MLTISRLSRTLRRWKACCGARLSFASSGSSPGQRRSRCSTARTPADGPLIVPFTPSLASRIVPSTCRGCASSSSSRRRAGSCSMAQKR